MAEICWEQYPLVAQHELSRHWLTRQAHLQLAPKTIDAYGRSLNDYLGFCAKRDIQPEAVTRDLVALYVQDLAHRPNPKGANFSPSRVAEGYQTPPCSSALPSCACFATSSSSTSFARITPLVEAISSRVTHLVGCGREGCFPVTRSCLGSPLTPSGKISSERSKMNDSEIK